MEPSADQPWPPYYYRREGALVIPSGLTRSPWNRNAIAGGPISALLAASAEDGALDEGFEIARFSVDIFGIVPHQPLGIVVTALRQGRQTLLHRIELTVDGKPVAQAHVLRVRRAEAPRVDPPNPYPHPDTVEEKVWLHGATMAGAVRSRPVLGQIREPGRGVAWLSMNGEVIAGETPSNFVKAAMFADFGNGVGSATRADEWSFANLDITLQFLRMPVGEWLLIDADTTMAGNGHGTAVNTFADIEGVFARGFQTVFVAPSTRKL